MLKNQTGRITFSPRPLASSAIEAVMARTGMSKTEVLNRAAVLYDSLQGMAGDDGLLIARDAADPPVRIIFL